MENKLKVLFNNTQVKNKGMLQEVGRRVNWEIGTDTYALLCTRQIIRTDYVAHRTPLSALW